MTKSGSLWCGGGEQLASDPELALLAERPVGHLAVASVLIQKVAGFELGR